MPEKDLRQQESPAENFSPQVEALLENKKITDGAEQPLELNPELFPKELLIIAEKLQELTQTWNPVEFVTASKESIRREKAIFMESYQADQEYNPQFDYPGVANLDINTQEVRQQLEEMLHQVRVFPTTSEQDRLARTVLYFKIKDDIATIDIFEGIRNRDEKQIKAGMTAKYAGTDHFLVAVAEKLYKEKCQDSENNLVESQSLLSQEDQELLTNFIADAAAQKKAYDWMLQQYGVMRSENNPQGFKVVISSQVTSTDVRDKSAEPMTIYIPEDKQTTGKELVKLLAHEIEAHVRQSMNGLKYVVGGGSLKVDDETLYEGLAKRNDETLARELFGDESGIPLPFYTLAIKKAETGASFVEIFTDQVERRLHVELKIDPQTAINFENEAVQQQMEKVMSGAWMTTYRVMRGHIDTSNPEGFAFAKDLAYLRGWLIDKQLTERGLGHLNEAAILQTNALPLMGRFRLAEQDLPFPYHELAKKYCLEVLLPELKAKAANNALTA